MLGHGLAAMALVALAAPGAAIAQQSGGAEWLVRVKPGPKRYFYLDNSERTGCPARTNACLRDAYVVPGDALIAERESRGFTRVTFIAAGSVRPTRGWIETAALVRVKPGTPRLDAWWGNWSGWNGSIEIVRSSTPGRLHLDGMATAGSHDPDRVARGAINMGDFEADLAPVGDRLTYPEGADPQTPNPDEDCRIQIRLLGPYLSVADQGMCGGMGVTFAGVYRK